MTSPMGDTMVKCTVHTGGRGRRHLRTIDVEVNKLERIDMPAMIDVTLFYDALGTALL